MKGLCSLLVLCLFGASVATLFPSRTDSRAPRRGPAGLADGIAWNGGKGRGPFEVSSPQAGTALPADREVAVEVLLRFRADCERLEVRVRGLDGVQVLSHAREEFASCEPGRNLAHPVKVRLPAGTNGLLAVDVSYVSGASIHRETRSIALADARGLENTSQRFQQQMTTEVGNGERLQIFQGESPSDGGHGGLRPVER